MSHFVLIDKTTNLLVDIKDKPLTPELLSELKSKYNIINKSPYRSTTAWLVVDINNNEYYYTKLPKKNDNKWVSASMGGKLPKGGIKTIIGRRLKFTDDPVMISRSDLDKYIENNC